MRFTKDNIEKTFTVTNNKVLTTIKVGSSWITNPTLETFLNQGWEIIEEPVAEVIESIPYVPTRSEVIEEYIREHGYSTYGAELAVINNYMQNPSEYTEEYNSYIQTRIDAKEFADETITRSDE